MFTMQAILDYWHFNLNHFLYHVSHHYFTRNTSSLTHIYISIPPTFFL